MNKKNELYDELSRLLTEYEESDIDNLDAFDWLEEMYDMLVKIQNNWDDVICAE